MADVVPIGYEPEWPMEIWILKSLSGQWVVSADYFPEGNAYQAFFSEQDARFACQYQLRSYGVQYEPERVK